MTPATTTDWSDTAAPFATPHRMLDVGHSQVPYWRFGEGPDVFFVHGWPLTGATFRDALPVLSQAFTCHVIDLPGTGQSVWDAQSEIGIAEHGKTVATVIDQLGLKAYALVGHDSGAAIMRLAAVEHGDRVKALVMSNTEIPGHHPAMVKVFSVLAKTWGSKGMFRLALKTGWLRRSALLFKPCFSDVHFAEGAFKTLFVDSLVNDPHLLAGQMRLVDTFDTAVIDTLQAKHALIKAPVLLVWGVDDHTYFPVAKARPMLEQFGGTAELIELPGKLFVHEEHAALFAEHTQTFLKSAF